MPRLGTHPILQRVSSLIDLKLFIAQTVNFLLLVLLLNHLLYKPVRKFLDNRTAQVEEQLKNAEHNKKVAQEMRLTLETELAQGKQQAKEYLEQAIRRSEQLHDELVEQAKQESHGIKQRAQEDLQRERDKVLSELRQEVVQLSFGIASKVIKESVDKKKHEHLVKETLALLDSQELGGQL